MKRILGLVIGAVAGGLLGYYQVFCTGGQCAAVGSWYGGAILGGLLGAVIAGGCPACAGSTCKPDRPGESPTAGPSDQG